MTRGSSVAPGRAVTLHLQVRFSDGFVALSTFEEAPIRCTIGDFPPELDPAPGQVVAFETPGGHETSGVVMEREGERVRVDFNHPFAGRSLTLRVKVLAVD